MVKEKLLVTGSLGLVGSRFVELFPDGDKLLTPDLPDFDITDKNYLSAYFLEHCPYAVLHFAAYTDVSEAEKQKGNKEEVCWQVNVTGTENLVAASKKTGSAFYHISTDMVFPGSAEDPGPYPEDHQPETDPRKLTWYGFSKAIAEEVVKQADGSVIRIIYPVRAKYTPKLDYLRKPLKLYDQGKLYPLFTDQQVSISYIDEVSIGLQKIIAQSQKGIFHISSPDTTSPFELVSYLIAEARGKQNAVKPALLTEFLKQSDNPVRYPRFGGLQVDKTQKILDAEFSTWRQIIDRLVDQGIGT